MFSRTDSTPQTPKPLPAKSQCSASAQKPSVTTGPSLCLIPRCDPLNLLVLGPLGKPSRETVTKADSEQGQNNCSFPARNPRADVSFHKHSQPRRLPQGPHLPPPAPTTLGKTWGWRNSGKSHWLKPHDLCPSAPNWTSWCRTPGDLGWGSPGAEGAASIYRPPLKHSPHPQYGILQNGILSGRSKSLTQAALPEASKRHLNFNTKLF